jgi:NAD(P)-dependent dehydrogenase (short-subunit alcohol dehydrogenase family)
MNELSDKVAIITGGGYGIGKQIALKYGAAGAKVVLAARSIDPMKQTCAELEKLGARAIQISTDVSKEADCAKMAAETVKAFGRIDILVNNAGVGEQGSSTPEQSVDGFDRVLAVHLRGAFLMSREVGLLMRARRSGSIVNISSIAGHAGIPGRNAYGAAKAGLSAMTRAMACEWARDGVRVNAVAPGYVRTALVEDLERRGALDVHAIVARTPMGRMAKPDEIAEAIAFLASNRASYVTGATLNVDGGWLAFGAPESALAPLGND